MLEQQLFDILGHEIVGGRHDHLLYITHCLFDQHFLLLCLSDLLLHLDKIFFARHTFGKHYHLGFQLGAAAVTASDHDLRCEDVELEEAH
jgi:hypothetical protein